MGSGVDDGLDSAADEQPEVTRTTNKLTTANRFTGDRSPHLPWKFPNGHPKDGRPWRRWLGMSVDLDVGDGWALRQPGDEEVLGATGFASCDVDRGPTNSTDSGEEAAKFFVRLTVDGASRQTDP